MNQPQLNIIVPLYNEEAIFDSLIERLQQLIEKLPLSIEIILIDDGSTDRTVEKMRVLALANQKFQCLFFSRNFGHEMALSAGLKYANATEAILIMDGDLQDPPELLEEMYAKHIEGYDVVYAIRKNRKEAFLKKLAYKWFYKTLKKMASIDMPLDAGDFSLISMRVVKHLNNMPEESRYLRGMRSWVGFKQIGVTYEREKRNEGKSKYSLKKLIRLALNGIFNFSEYPIKFIINLGILTVITSLIYFISVVIKKLFYDSVPEGFTALLFMIILFGGLQLVAIGLIGQYVQRIFFQVKNRPLFIIKERIVKQEIHYED